MKKRIRYPSMLNKPVVKAIPLTAALSLLSTGAVMAEVDKIQVLKPNDTSVIAEFDVNLMNANPKYAEAMKAALEKAFEDSNTMVVRDDDEWIDFGGNAKEGLTYKTIAKETKEGIITGAEDKATEFAWANADGSEYYLNERY